MGPKWIIVPLWVNLHFSLGTNLHKKDIFIHKIASE